MGIDVIKFISINLWLRCNVQFTEEKRILLGTWLNAFWYKQCVSGCGCGRGFEGWVMPTKYWQQRLPLLPPLLLPPYMGKAHHQPTTNTCRQHNTELWMIVVWCLNFHTRINCAHTYVCTRTHAHILLLIYSYVRKCSQINDNHPYVCSRTFDNFKHKLNLNLDFQPHPLRCALRFRQRMKMNANSVDGMGTTR